MVLIKEIRIPMPFTLEEYKIGQRYSVARCSNENTSTSEGIEILENKPYEHTEPNDSNKKSIGTYTKKIYHLKSLIPGWVTPFLPDSATKLYEEAWDVFPYCKTVLTFPFLGDRFVFTIESRHTVDDLGKIDNIHNLDKEKLKNRHVELLDIAKEQPEKKYYKKEEDPTLYTSKVSGKGPLTPNWLKDTKQIMCCYKLVTVRCKITGLQSKVEKFMMNLEKSIFLKFHQQMYCWMDEWYGKSLEDIIEIEAKYFNEMNKKLENTVQAEKEAEKKDDKSSVSGKETLELPPESSKEEDEKDSEES